MLKAAAENVAGVYLPKFVLSRDESKDSPRAGRGCTAGEPSRLAEGYTWLRSKCAKTSRIRDHSQKTLYVDSPNTQASSRNSKAP